jgi:hypothetical protein
MKKGDRNNYQQTDLNHLLYFQGLDEISHQSKRQSQALNSISDINSAVQI